MCFFFLFFIFIIILHFIRLLCCAFNLMFFRNNNNSNINSTDTECSADLWEENAVASFSKHKINLGASFWFESICTGEKWERVHDLFSMLVVFLFVRSFSAFFVLSVSRPINYIIPRINNSDKRNTEAFDNVSILQITNLINILQNLNHAIYRDPEQYMYMHNNHDASPHSYTYCIVMPLLMSCHRLCIATVNKSHEIILNETAHQNGVFYRTVRLVFCLIFCCCCFFFAFYILYFVRGSILKSISFSWFVALTERMLFITFVFCS